MDTAPAIKPTVALPIAKPILAKIPIIPVCVIFFSLSDNHKANCGNH